MQAVYHNPDHVPVQRGYRNRPAPRMLAPTPESLSDVVYLLDNDPSFYDELSSALSAGGVSVVRFSTAIDYLNFDGMESAACVVANSHLPDLNGSELQRRLAAKSNRPLIFIGDRLDIAFTVSAMKAGAIDFFIRPFEISPLVLATQSAFIQDRKRRQRAAELHSLRTRFCLLTPREQEVLPLVIGGLLNKQAAAVLGISEVTLQIHRSQVMRKMRADSVADLVRIAMKLGIPHWRGDRQAEAETRSAPGLRVAVEHAGPAFYSTGTKTHALTQVPNGHDRWR